MNCINCGRREDEHCEEFMPPNIPSGCICDTRSWGDPASIPDVCFLFVGDKDNYCHTCEHDRECHAEPKG